MKLLVSSAPAALVAALALGPSAAAAPPPPPTPTAPTPPPAAPTGPSSTGADAAKSAEVFQKGMELDRDGKLAASCVLYAEAVRLTPVFGLARYELAQCLRLTGDIEDDALVHITEAEKDMKRPPIYIERGRILEDRGDKDGAAAAYKEALTLLAAEVRAQAGLARVAEAADGKLALERLQVYTQSNPQDPAGWKKLAEIAEAQKKLPIAEQALLQLVECAKNKKQAIGALHAFAVRTKKKDLADKAMDMWRRGGP
ncbi:MAG: hypothetical protein U1F43_25045 [Myxococcota bacterium]